MTTHQAKPEKAEEPAEPDRRGAVITAAKALVAGWSQSGFYDRQDPADAFALDEALAALRKR